MFSVLHNLRILVYFRLPISRKSSRKNDLSKGIELRVHANVPLVISSNKFKVNVQERQNKVQL